MMRRSFLLGAFAACVVALSWTSAADARPRVGSRYRSYSYGGPLIARPQYPKSMRQRGLRQLGPVPAMGGVRSLPFWGGER
jgi:hypothetical protein